MTRPSFGAHRRSHAEDAWLDALLRGARSTAIEDAGFCASVVARVASQPAVLAPAVALAALRRAESRERANTRWTIAGTLVGAFVAAAVGSHQQVGAVDPAGMLLPALALLLASTVLAWLAIYRS